MRAVIVGASAGLGRAIAEQLAKLGQDLVLIAREAKDLQALANDLTLRHNTFNEVLAIDLSKLSEENLLKIKNLKSIKDIYYVAGYSLLKDDFRSLNFSQISQICQINFQSGVQIITSLLPQITAQQGQIVGIGSIAQARPRSFNTVYAASKCALEFYFSGLRHALTEHKVKVRFYRVGFMETSLNQDKGLLPKAKPESVAAAIILDSGKSFIGCYLPHWWRIIMLVYRAIPWFIYKNFGK